MNSVKYGCTALAGSNKKGILKPDEHGYYKVILGALNHFNSAGIWYDFETSKGIFDNSDSFMRRMSTGNLYGEREHPTFNPGMSEEAFVQRINRIDGANIAFHIRNIELVTGDPGVNGVSPIIVVGYIKPDRTHGAELKAALDNPCQNVCFSVRCLMEEFWSGGKKCRTITDLVTFDWVIEPGISIANKYNSPALEAFTELSEHEVSAQILRNVIALNKRNATVGLESFDDDKLCKVLTKMTASVYDIKPLAIAGWA